VLDPVTVPSASANATTWILDLDGRIVEMDFGCGPKTPAEVVQQQYAGDEFLLPPTGTLTLHGSLKLVPTGLYSFSVEGSGTTANQPDLPCNAVTDVVSNRTYDSKGAQVVVKDGSGSVVSSATLASVGTTINEGVVAGVATACAIPFDVSVPAAETYVVQGTAVGLKSDEQTVTLADVTSNRRVELSVSAP
jgi:hypothetical protein